MKKQAGDFLTTLYTHIGLLKITGNNNNCIKIATYFVVAEVALLGKFNAGTMVAVLKGKTSAEQIGQGKDCRLEEESALLVIIKSICLITPLATTATTTSSFEVLVSSLYCLLLQKV